jgi:hypothetical protein
MRERHLTADSVVTVETTVTIKPRHVDFQDIYDAIEVVDDPMMTDAPWESQDGYEHHAALAREDAFAADKPGYCASAGKVITLEHDQSLFDWYRERGCSRQVARELVARSMKQTLAQVVEWYEHGWNWYGVTGDYLGYHDSLWGIDDTEYAENSVRDDIASQIAHAMEQDGFVIENKPEHPEYIGRGNMTRDNWQNHFRRNVNLFNTGERT